MEATTELYEKFRPMIYKFVLRYTNRYEWADHDELLSEANYIFIRAAKTFNPDFGVKFSTHLYHALRLKLINCSTRSRDVWYQPRVGSDIVDRIDLFRWIDLIDELHGDVRIVVKILLHTGWQRAARTELRKRGWHERRIRRSFDDIKLALK